MLGGLSWSGGVDSAAESMAPPQCPQKRDPGGQEAPHEGQIRASWVPQPAQNFASEGFSSSQLEHFTV